MACLALLAMASCQAILGIEDTTESTSSGDGGGVGGFGGNVGGTGGTDGGGTGGLTDSGNEGQADVDPCAQATANDFLVTQPVDVIVAPNGSVTVPVQVTRGACFDAELTITLKGGPGSITAQQSTIAATTSDGSLELNAANNAAPGAAPITVGVAGGGKSHDVTLQVTVRGAPGTLDNSFSSDGFFLKPGGYADAVATQSTGEIVASVAGSWSLIRVDAYGFEDAGFLPTMPSSGASDDMLVDAMDRIVALGHMSNTVVIVRLNADGTPDTTFATGGVYSLATSTTLPAPTGASIALQSDGKLVIGGASGAAGDQGFLARIDPEKSGDKLDWAIAPPVLAGCDIDAVGVQATGRVVGACTTAFPTLNTRVIGITTAGAIDASFGSGTGATLGTRTMDSGNQEYTYDLTITASDNIILASATEGGGDVQSAVQFFASDGKTSFNTLHPIPGSYSHYFGCATAGDKFLAVGYGPSAGEDTSRVVRYENGAQMDTSFGTSGYLQLNSGTPSEVRLFTVTTDKDGRIVAAGSSAGNTLIVRVWD